MTNAARALASSPVAVRQAVAVRDACNVLIREALTDGIDPETNGEALVARVQGPATRTFIDVGANVGDWAALLLESLPPDGAGVLFEPSAQAAERLRLRFADRPAIEVAEVAVSDAAGQASFFEEPDAGWTSSLVPGISTPTAIERTVAVTTIDLEASRRGIESIDLLKIDAEGNDLRVLHGAGELLAAQRIGAVQFEYGRAWLQAKSTLGEAYRLLDDCGYCLFVLGGAALTHFDYRRYGEYFGYSNFVALAPSAMPAFGPYLAVAT
jgi:FkbM family methyltransferase